MANQLHKHILQLIKARSGTPTQHTFSDSYLGNNHPRYPINAPTLRAIAKDWMREHRSLPMEEFAALLTSLIEGPSFTEKVMAGLMMDYATKEQMGFDPRKFDKWLDHLIGWAEVDSVCTGKYTKLRIPLDWKKWEVLLRRFARSRNIQKRRASLVLLCSPVSHSTDKVLAQMALENVSLLQSEKEVLITKAISWILRSMIRHHRKLVAGFVKANRETLPSIAVRETLKVLKTGKKTTSRVKE